MTEPTREQLDNLLDHAHKRRLGPDEVGRIREGIANLRQQLALSQAGASRREMLLTEARDALEEHGGHGDAWPDIVAPILKLIEERDKWRRRYRMAYDRAEIAEAGDQRVRDLHSAIVFGDGQLPAKACSGCEHGGDSVPWPCATLQALDADDQAVPNTRAEQAEKLLREVVDLAELTHRYGAMGGHDRAGLNLGCAGCELHRRIRAALDAAPAWRGISPDSLLTSVDEAGPAADTEPT